MQDFLNQLMLAIALVYTALFVAEFINGFKTLQLQPSQVPQPPQNPPQILFPENILPDPWDEPVKPAKKPRFLMGAIHTIQEQPALPPAREPIKKDYKTWTLSKLKEEAKRLNIKPNGDSRKKQSWIRALSACY